MATGRPKCKIWQLYHSVPEKVHEDGRKRTQRAVCKFCDEDVVGHTDRMVKHAQICKKIPEPLKKSVLSSQQGTRSKSSGTSSVSSLSLLDQPLQKQQKISDFVDRPLTNEEIRLAHEHLTLALITGNVPWNFLQNAHFKRYCCILRPSMPLLSRDKAVNSVLSSLEAKATAGIHGFIRNAKSITLATDSWTSSASQNYVSWVVINEKSETELYAVESGDTTKTAEGIVKEDQTSGILLAGACLAHQSNLLVKDLMTIERIWRVLEKGIRVASFVRRSIALRSSICRYMGRETIAMWIPTESRWNSASVTLTQLLNIQVAIGVVFVEDHAEPYLQTPNALEVRNIVTNSVFWANVNDIHLLLKPYAAITGISELTYSSAGLILTGWAWLKSTISKSNFLHDDEKATVITKMKKRSEKYISPHHLISWVLDPRSRGCGLSKAGRRLVRDLGRQVYCKLFPDHAMKVNELMRQWVAYDQRLGTFDKDGSIWSQCIAGNPMVFWTDLDTEAVELARLAKTVLSCAPHSASCERVWSSAAAIVTKARNRLKMENLSSILKVKHHFMTKKKTDVQCQSVFNSIIHLIEICHEEPESLTAEDDAVVSSHEDCIVNQSRPSASSEVLDNDDIVENEEVLLSRVHAMMDDWEDDLVNYSGGAFSFSDAHTDAECDREVRRLILFAAQPQQL